MTGRIKAILATATRAQNKGQKLRIRYRKECGEESTRTVFPERVWQSKAKAFLITGHDELRDDVRTFRVDRVQTAEVVQ